ARARLRAVGHEAGRLSGRERGPARRCGGGRVLRGAARARRGGGIGPARGAEPGGRRGGAALRRAPAARGVGGVDHRAPRCALRRLLPAGGALLSARRRDRRAAAHRLVFYACKTLLPTGLAPLYEAPSDYATLTPWFAASAVVVGAATVALVVARRRWPGVTAAGAAFVVLLLPVLGLLHFGLHI